MPTPIPENIAVVLNQLEIDEKSCHINNRNWCRTHLFFDNRLSFGFDTKNGKLSFGLYSGVKPDFDHVLGPWLYNQAPDDLKSDILRALEEKRAKGRKGNGNSAEEGSVCVHSIPFPSQHRDTSEWQNVKDWYDSVLRFCEQMQNDWQLQRKAFCSTTDGRKAIEEYIKDIFRERHPRESSRTDEPEISETVSPMKSSTKYSSENSIGSRNLIFFGAPGTGKSHELNRKVNDMFPDRYERVTFYPTYSYAQFVGCYKPVMKRKTAGEAEKTDVESASNISIEELAQKLKRAYDAAANAEPGQTAAVLLFAEQYIDALNAQGKSVAKSVVEKAGLPVTAYTAWLAAGIRAASFKAKQSAETNEEEVSYKFVPGPFLRLLVKALNDPAQDYCLVIEEINRANAAAVFGDMFQLLDRATQNSNDGNVKKGESEYDIEASEDIKKFLKENGIERNKLRIPANMYIWATMNSADQGVFPMDTAFKRRWEFEYIGIDNGVDAAGNGALPPDQWTIAGKKHKFKWNEVRQFVNDLLSENGVNEDKLMGAHFVTVTETDEKGLLSIVSENTFKSKVLMYLWEDAARMSRKRFFADGIGIRTFADLRKQWDDKGVAVFKSGKKDGKDVVPPKDLNEAAKEPIDP